MSRKYLNLCLVADTITRTSNKIRMFGRSNSEAGYTLLKFRFMIYVDEKHVKCKKEIVENCLNEH